MQYDIVTNEFTSEELYFDTCKGKSTGLNVYYFQQKNEYMFICSNNAVGFNAVVFDSDFQATILNSGEGKTEPYYNEDIDGDEYLINLSLKGLNKRFEGDIPNNYKIRLKYELDIIKQMGFSNYFLVVYDFIKYAKKNCCCDHFVEVEPNKYYCIPCKISCCPIVFCRICFNCINKFFDSGVVLRTGVRLLCCYNCLWQNM